MTMLQRPYPGISFLSFNLFACCLLSAFLMWMAGCQTSEGRQTKRIPPRDTSIDSQTAFIPLFMDSAVLHTILGDRRMKEADSTRVAVFYHVRNYQYAWMDSTGLGEQTINLMNLIRSYRNTLPDSSLYYPLADSLYAAHQEGTDSVRRLLSRYYLPSAEVRLTAFFFHYAQTAYEGKSQLDLDKLGWHIPRKKIDLDEFLDSVIATRGEHIRSILPVHPQFTRLKEQIKKYTELEKKNDWPSLPVEKKAWRMGDSAAVVGAIKLRLQMLGDMPAGDSSFIFTPVLDSAIRHFQMRYGLTVDGVAGPSVIEALNREPREILRQLLINLERARWIPVPRRGRYLVVNIPEFTLYVYDSGQLQFTMPVVVGKPATNTIIFNGNMKYVVLSPYWNVPYSIVKNEMGRTAAYFSRRNMEIVGRYADGTPMVRQKPGPNNSLGRVKFLFPNSYNIYLHDTPAKSLFGENRRAFSHGCIRVAEPEKLAIFLLNRQTGWPPEKVREGMQANKEISITLSQEVPVFIGYFTATVSENGVLNLRPDIYGHDKKMAERLFPAQ